MSSERPTLKTLEVRKQLLIAEAEVLRHQVGADLEIIREGFKTMGQEVKSVATFASIAATVVTAVSAFRRKHKTESNGKPKSLLSNLLAGARTASTVWMAFRSRR